MAQFLADIAFLLALLVIAGGLGLLYLANRQAGTGLLRGAGYLLLVGGIGTALCTGYYWFRYQADGQFETAYPATERSQAMQQHMQEMHERMMQRMQQHSVPGNMPAAGSRAADEAEHDEHHPQ